MLELWAWSSTFWLCILCYQDIKKMVVDSRRNYFMTGLTFGLIYVLEYSLAYFFSLIISTFAFSFFLYKFTKIGLGDVRALGWIFLGYLLINPNILIMYIVILILLTIVYKLLMNYFKKQKYPFYPVILFSFFLVSFWHGLY